ncbi:hypothetical protein BU23DRAFT_559889 [Bimuria novae-zelandiae CBS 107.79]|uniref:Cytosolic endo-beta-N-acetylglucosaminidase TIM barrel domain-containing protein n=1 Tax=Bimuria novae-zelandiae CBS 107.79 TaxID=1447943 RepID=A0A6A5UVC7_9PLEO|nr:hypothetical protein BU23DRAFT_559889 [Bimuria novae-zelandiae CBS 107.79]
MVFLFGWKDILRPIRDGYRHLFPSPDTGPTPEEREKQRRLDRLKGFTYFDTFAQLEEWTESESDPIQRANTPLLNRSSGASTSSGSKANVLLCHDFAGNYQDYEASTNISVDGFRYYCEYLQYVESFVYFSHKLVCVPPPPWTNTLHRNGVKVFGTLLIEPQTESSDRLLRSTLEDDDGQTNETFPLARKLAQIARHYGFDGWLVNIEKPFTRNVWDPELVEAFLGSLKGEMGDVGELIWSLRFRP